MVMTGFFSYGAFKKRPTHLKRDLNSFEKRPQETQSSCQNTKRNPPWSWQGSFECYPPNIQQNSKLRLASVSLFTTQSSLPRLIWKESSTSPWRISFCIPMTISSLIFQRWVFKVEVSFQMSHLKRDLLWPWRISFCIPMTISSLVCQRTGMGWRRIGGSIKL